MKLNDLKPQDGSKKDRRRVGRGISAGRGKTAGRGTKGQGSRSGGSTRLYHQGGNLPFFRRLRPGVYTAAGYSGHGVAIATFAGKLLAEAIDGDTSRFDVMASIPAQKFPGGRLLRRPTLVLAMSWFALRDRLG